MTPEERAEHWKTQARIWEGKARKCQADADQRRQTIEFLQEALYKARDELLELKLQKGRRHGL